MVAATTDQKEILKLRLIALMLNFTTTISTSSVTSP